MKSVSERKYVLASKRFNLSDQRAFGYLTGDFNPGHFDQRRMRRELFGDIVVHGLQVVCFCLDAYFKKLNKKSTRRIMLSRIKCNFIQPLYLEQKITAIYSGDAFIKVSTGYSDILNLKIEYEASDEENKQKTENYDKRFNRRPALKKSLEDIKSAKGKISLHFYKKILSKKFPYLKKHADAMTVAHLLSLTRLVGMYCPGERSIFSSFDISIKKSEKISKYLNYQVLDVDERFSKVALGVDSHHIQGNVEAFLRPAPVEQKMTGEISTSIKKEEFLGHQALIIGGSRGLGEVTAKIIAVGGGFPVITYRTGREDALSVRNDIKSSGYLCDVLPFDIFHPRIILKKLNKEKPVLYVYYFASPKIFVAKNKVFEDSLFKGFCHYYVEGFVRLYQAIRHRWKHELVMFYPSTVALEEKTPGLEEYAMAKSKGEGVCASLNRADKHLNIVIERLPRIYTDQTVSLLHHPTTDAVDVMLNIVRRLHRLSSTGRE